MSTTTITNIYESTFAPSDETDAILVVGEKKLHVNKAFLSHYSDYFKTLFNADFKEKSMPEIPIEEVEFEDFAALLGLFQKNPISPTEENAEKLLELADRFLIPAAKPQLEFFLISTKIAESKKMKIADKYKLDILLNNTLNFFKHRQMIISCLGDFTDLSDTTKARILDRFTVLRFNNDNSSPNQNNSGPGPMRRVPPHRQQH